MKTPTLIVRLVGLYLLATGSVSLLQLHKAQAMAGQFAAQNPMMANFSIYLWLGMCIGVGATIWAGPLARLLTFDSDPSEKSRDVSDRYSGR